MSPVVLDLVMKPAESEEVAALKGAAMESIMSSRMGSGGRLVEEEEEEEDRRDVRWIL